MVRSEIPANSREGKVLVMRKGNFLCPPPVAWWPHLSCHLHLPVKEEVRQCSARGRGVRAGERTVLG